MFSSIALPPDSSGTTSAVTPQNVSRHCHMSPGEPKLPCSRTRGGGGGKSGSRAPALLCDLGGSQALWAVFFICKVRC